MLLFQLFACYTRMSNLKQTEQSYPELKKDRETPTRLNKTRLENVRSRLHLENVSYIGNEWRGEKREESAKRRSATFFSFLGVARVRETLHDNWSPRYMGEISVDNRSCFARDVSSFGDMKARDITLQGNTAGEHINSHGLARTDKTCYTTLTSKQLTNRPPSLSLDSSKDKFTTYVEIRVLQLNEEISLLHRSDKSSRANVHAWIRGTRIIERHNLSTTYWITRYDVRLVTWIVFAWKIEPLRSQTDRLRFL